MTEVLFKVKNHKKLMKNKCMSMFTLAHGTTVKFYSLPNQKIQIHVLIFEGEKISIKQFAGMYILFQIKLKKGVCTPCLNLLSGFKPDSRRRINLVS